MELIPGFSFGMGEPTGRPAIQPRNQQIYSETVGGSKDFRGGFACYSGHGPEMKVTVTNTGTTTIYGIFMFTSNGESGTIDDFVVALGSSNYITAKHDTGEGLELTCSFTLSTYSATQGMNCEIYAEQGYGLV